MSMEKTKTFIKAAMEEGSISILTLTISCILILSQFPESFISDVIQILYAAGFIVAFAVIVFRIALSQYLKAKAKSAQLKQDIKTGNLESYLADDNLASLAVPILDAVIKKVSKDKDFDLDEIIKKLEE